MIGHTNGGMLAVKRVADHLESPATALLSAHGGGDGGMKLTGRAGLLAADRFEAVAAEARALVAAGRGREWMPVPGWSYVITAESFLDRMIEMPDLIELAPAIRRAASYIRGDREDPETYPAEVFQDRAGAPCDVEIVPDCDHFYVGREAVICDLVSGWLTRTFNLAR